ncbi:MAG: DUF1289 domain-containing protein [Alphaproteobacteria bacterium]|nr:DUF1289 domain-containing protein [Alphaproteobacteria bacterium]
MRAYNSPCQKACALDLEVGRCQGCLRTPREIYQWGMLAPVEQRRAVQRLARHRARIRRRKQARLERLGY